MILVCERIGDRHGTEQIADEVVQFRIGDEVRRLLIAQRSAQEAGEPDQCLATARQTVRTGIRADHLALHAECGGLQRDKVDVSESRTVRAVAEH